VKANHSGSPAARAPRARRREDDPSGAETGAAGMGRTAKPTEPTGSGRMLVFVVPQANPGAGDRTDPSPGALGISSAGAVKLLLDYKGAAVALSLSEQALRDLVAKGYGPAVTKIRGRRLFAIADLIDFIEKHRCCTAATDRSDPWLKGRRRQRQLR